MDYGKIGELLVVGSDGTLSKIHVRGDYNGGMRVVGDIEAHIHDGKLFSYSDIHSNVASGSTNYHLLDNSSGGSAHLHISELGLSNVPFQLRLYEGPVVSSLGALDIVRNRNRNFTDSNALKIYSAPVVSSVGAPLDARVLSYVINAGIAEAEWLLKPNTRYLLGLTSQTGGLVGADYSLGLLWLED